MQLLIWHNWYNISVPLKTTTHHSFTKRNIIALLVVHVQIFTNNSVDIFFHFFFLGKYIQTAVVIRQLTQCRPTRQGAEESPQLPAQQQGKDMGCYDTKVCKEFLKTLCHSMSLLHNKVGQQQGQRLSSLMDPTWYISCEYF